MAKPKAIPSKKPPIPQKSVAKFLPPWESGQAGPARAPAEEGEAYNFDHIGARVKATRRLFVMEFVKDFNGTAALLRMGLNYSQPAVTANEWLREPYTQHILDRYIDEAEESAIITRNKILAGLVREANSYGLDSSGAARVSAFGKLAKILGLEIVKVEGNVTVAGGVMFVPLAGTPDEWEANAAAAQAALKAGAKS